MSLRQAPAQVRRESSKGGKSVGDALLAAKILQLLAADPAAGEHKLETRVIGVAFDDGGNGVEIVGEAEVAE